MYWSIRTLRAIPLNFNKNAIVKFRFSFGIVEIQENPSCIRKKGKCRVQRTVLFKRHDNSYTDNPRWNVVNRVVSVRAPAVCTATSWNRPGLIPSGN